MNTERYISEDFSADVIINDITKLCSRTNLGANSVGMLYCNTELDSKKIVSALCERLSIPVIGGTIMCFLSEDTSAIFMLLHGDDVCFSVVATNLSDSDYKAEVEALYHKGLSELAQPPKLIIPFMPYIRNANTVDDSSATLFELAKNIPVFGGVCADDMLDNVAAIFCDKQYYTQNSLALLMIGGNIKPVFSKCAQVSKMTEYSPLVTRAEGDRLYDVDGMPFVEYAKRLGVNELPYSVLRFDELDCTEEFAHLRSIYDVAKDGSYVSITASAPQPSRVSMVLLTKDNVLSSAKACVTDIKQKIAANELDGYKYSLTFSISCASRYFAYVGSTNEEQEFISKELPEAASYYAFGEIGPVVLEELVQNRLNNVSLVICAI